MGFEIKHDADEHFRQEFNAEDFQTSDFVSQNLDFNLPFGKISGRQWTFDGIRITYAETTYNNCGEMEWKGDAEMITMHFNLKGRISISDLHSEQNFELSNNQHNIFYGKESERIIKIKELDSKTFLVQFSKNAFLKIADIGNDAIKKFVENITNNNPVAFSDKNLEIDFLLHQCILSILNCPFDDSVKRIYFTSKVIELLALQAESFIREKKSLQTLSEYDRERILYAKDFLIKNIDCPPNLIELARVSGINEFKLKKGFKEIFGTTVFQYLSDTRLNLAKTELLKKEKSIGEIAYNLGYSSVQHFSNSFKKKFGISPSEVL